MEKRTIGKNIEATVDGDVLTLVIDLSQSLGPSRSGKTTLIASMNGNSALGDVRVGINVYRRRDAQS